MSQPRKVPRVVHWKKEPCDVYVGRPSKWGNPFEIGRDGDRAAVIQKYEAWLQSKPELLAEVKDLKGKVLGCWCAPRPCHADVLLRLANLDVASRNSRQDTLPGID